MTGRSHKRPPGAAALFAEVASFLRSGAQLPDGGEADQSEPGTVPTQRRLWLRAEAVGAARGRPVRPHR